MGNLVEEPLITEVKSQWKRMWRERIDDRERAESVAGTDFDKLFVERGTVVLATRSFKLVTLREILERHEVADAERHVPPCKQVGGWGARGARNVASYALYSLLRLFLSRDAAENINRADKALSPTYFNT